MLVRLPSSSFALVIHFILILPNAVWGMSNVDYVNQCLGAGVEVPADLSCEGGTELPVTQSTCDANGEVVSKVTVTQEMFARFTRRDHVDHPALVQRLSAHAGSVPGGRFVWRVSATTPSVCAMVCRRTNNDLPRSRFNDISLICHNPDNGATCFFNSKVDESRFPKGHTGGPLPQPGSPRDEVWMAPAELNTATCTDCHDKGPFLTTPNLRSVRDVIHKAVSPFGKYYVVGEGTPFNTERWKKRYILNEDNSCTQCHRMGAGRHGGCGHLRDVAVGQSKYLKPSPCGFEKGFMPPEGSDDREGSRRSVDRLKECCQDFDQEGRLKAVPRCQWNLLPSS